MKTVSLDIEPFLALSGAILDVRSPAEYAHGRIPGAVSLPLFDDAERAAVGTTYKQVGRQQAIQQGLQLVGPKLANFTSIAANYVGDSCAKVHCWRGGMRSSSMAWLLNTVGLPTATLNGGYKTFRRWVLDVLSQLKQVQLIGGLTGSGKTALLHALRDSGEQVLDLEQLANHRGSSYGMLGMPPQPSTEQFENEIAFQWASFNAQHPVWIEDESRMIGSCKIPDAIYSQMRQAPLYFVERSLPERLKNLTCDYGHIDCVNLIAATQRLQRRLGGARTKQIIDSITAGRLDEAMEAVLHYYDTTYRYALQRRQQPTHTLNAEGLSSTALATLIRCPISLS